MDIRNWWAQKKENWWVWEVIGWSVLVAWAGFTLLSLVLGAAGVWRF